MFSGHGNTDVSANYEQSFCANRPGEKRKIDFKKSPYEIINIGLADTNSDIVRRSTGNCTNRSYSHPSRSIIGRTKRDFAGNLELIGRMLFGLTGWGSENSHGASAPSCLLLTISLATVMIEKKKKKG